MNARNLLLRCLMVFALLPAARAAEPVTATVYYNPS